VAKERADRHQQQGRRGGAAAGGGGDHRKAAVPVGGSRLMMGDKEDPKPSKGQRRAAAIKGASVGEVLVLKAPASSKQWAAPKRPTESAAASMIPLMGLLAGRGNGGAGGGGSSGGGWKTLSSGNASDTAAVEVANMFPTMQNAAAVAAARAVHDEKAREDHLRHEVYKSRAEEQSDAAAAAEARARVEAKMAKVAATKKAAVEKSAGATAAAAAPGGKKSFPTLTGAWGRALPEKKPPAPTKKPDPVKTKQQQEHARKQEAASAKAANKAATKAAAAPARELNLGDMFFVQTKMTQKQRKAAAAAAAGGQAKTATMMEEKKAFRGKRRLTAKKKKPSTLKKVILKERMERWMALPLEERRARWAQQQQQQQALFHRSAAQTKGKQAAPGAPAAGADAKEEQPGSIAAPEESGSSRVLVLSNVVGADELLADESYDAMLGAVQAYVEAEVATCKIVQQQRQRKLAAEKKEKKKERKAAAEAAEKKKKKCESVESKSEGSVQTHGFHHDAAAGAVAAGSAVASASAWPSLGAALAPPKKAEEPVAAVAAPLPPSAAEAAAAAAAAPAPGADGGTAAEDDMDARSFRLAVPRPSMSQPIDAEVVRAGAEVGAGASSSAVPNAPPTRVITLHDMVSVEEVEDDDEFEEIESDVRDMCAKFGTVAALAIPRDAADERAGVVTVEYATAEEARTAVAELDGKVVGGQAVVALLDTSQQERTVLVHNLVSLDELEDDDEYEEICDDVRAMCAKCGAVASLAIPRDEAHARAGMVVVEYGGAEQARTAVTHFNGKVVGGRTMRAELEWSGDDAGAAAAAAAAANATANAAAAAAAECSEPERTVLLYNLVTPGELEDDDEFEEIASDVGEMCERYGKLVSVAIPRAPDAEHAGVVLVLYADFAGAEAALAEFNGKIVGGRTIRAEAYATRPAASQGGSGAPGAFSRTVHIQHLVSVEEVVDDDEFEEIESDVRDMCAKFGTVAALAIPRDAADERAGVVTVEYATAEEARAAVTDLDGKVVSGRSLIAKMPRAAAAAEAAAAPAEKDANSREGGEAASTVGLVFVRFGSADVCKAMQQKLAGKVFRSRTLVAQQCSERLCDAWHVFSEDSQAATAATEAPPVAQAADAAYDGTPRCPRARAPFLLCRPLAAPLTPPGLLPTVVPFLARSVSGAEELKQELETLKPTGELELKFDQVPKMVVQCERAYEMQEPDPQANTLVTEMLQTLMTFQVTSAIDTARTSHRYRVLTCIPSPLLPTGTRAPEGSYQSRRSAPCRVWAPRGAAARAASSRVVPGLAERPDTHSSHPSLLPALSPPPRAGQARHQVQANLHDHHCAEH